MNASDLLLDQWTRQVKEIFPDLHRYQQDSLAFSVQGIIQSGNAVMQRVAEAMWEYLMLPPKSRKAGCFLTDNWPASP